MLETERYLDQAGLWPKSGRHILAHVDADSLIVYQAYQPSIGHFAAKNGYFGGDFSYARMSWIKSSFLWMMYRSSWGMKPGQEVILAIRISKRFFDDLLAQAVESSFGEDQYKDRGDWQRAVETSCVRLQWDPDRDPTGTPLQRRALQLGLLGKALEDYGKKEILEILDISNFVAEQSEHVSRERLAELLTPSERVYVPKDPVTQVRVGLDHE